MWSYANAGYTPGFLRTSSYNTLLCFKTEFEMKSFLFAVLLLISGHAFAADTYAFCQAQIDQMRELTSYPIENLNAYKGMLAKTTSLEELGELTGKDYAQFVPMAQKHQGITRAEAEVKTLELFKTIEINALSRAIKFHGLASPRYLRHLTAL